tara:strand:+ start:517 stop:888 length:372 start_codon:yes stop_codon:yes gene_type:complete
MAQQELAKKLYDQYNKNILTQPIFRDIEIKRFKKIESNLKNMSFEERAAEGDYVAKNVCEVSYQFALGFLKNQIETFLKGEGGKLNATSICNMAYCISLMKEDEKIKILALKIYKQMCEKYIK